MAAITAKMVNELRSMTGAGMMDCKKALVETEGNFDEAIKVLREKGLSKADKKAGRIASEGVVDILSENGVTAMIEVNAETDFVAKNATFKEFVRNILEVIVKDRPCGMTTRPGVFAGGDVVHRPQTVVLAMKAAQMVAEGIAQYVDAIKLLRDIGMKEI